MGQKFTSFFSKALIFLCFILFSSIFIYINYIAAPTFRAPVLKSLFITAVFLLVFVLVDKGFRMMKISENKKLHYTVLGIIIITGFVLRLYWINSVDTLQVSDFERMWQSAKEIASGDYSRFQKDGYLYTYPHLAFTTLFYTAVYKIFAGSITAMKMINALLSIGTCVLVYLIANELCDAGNPSYSLKANETTENTYDGSKGKAAGYTKSSSYSKSIALIIMAVNAPFIFFNNVLDSQNLAMVFFYGAVLIYLKVFNDRFSPFFLIASGILLSVGNLFRSVGIIFVIAMIMHMLIYSTYRLPPILRKGKKKLSLDRNLLKPMFLVLMLLAMYITTFALNYAFIWTGVFQKPTWDTGGNMILYINAGFNHESNGMWNQQDYDLLRDVNYDYDLAEIEAKNRLRERLSDKDKVMTLISNKFNIQWGTGDFGGLYWSTYKLGSNPKSTNDMLVWLNYHYYYIQSFYSALVLAVMIKLLDAWYNGRMSRAYYFGLILFTGFVCLHTIIEMQPRYGYIALPMITALGAASIGEKRRNL